MEAVRSRNCAITVQFPAATSWLSAIERDTKAKTTAARKEATAMEYSTARDFICLGLFWGESEKGLWVSNHDTAKPCRTLNPALPRVLEQDREKPMSGVRRHGRHVSSSESMGCKALFSMFFLTYCPLLGNRLINLEFKSKSRFANVVSIKLR